MRAVEEGKRDEEVCQGIEAVCFRQTLRFIDLTTEPKL
jgi:hypothetical protein